MTRRSTQTSQNTQNTQISASAASAAVSVVVPGDLETRTGGYGYDRRIIDGLRDLGWTVHLVGLDEGFPMPAPAARARAVESFAGIPDGSIVLVDGLALGALPDEVQREAERLTIVALVHHPLAAETGLDPARAAALKVSERRALAASRAVIVTSRATAVSLADYGVASDDITVVEPGTDPAPLAHGSMSHEPSEVSLLCVATLTPRKGYEILVGALAAIPRLNWRLTCAGGLDRDPATVARVRAQIEHAGFADRIALVGDRDATGLAADYDRADLFVLPTLYEGYGMAVAEAIARGLPVLSTATGAIATIAGDGGIIVPPGDAGAFTEALSRALGDADLRARLAAGAREARERLTTWHTAAAAMAQALERARGAATRRGA